MNTFRQFLLLAAGGLALGVIPEALALDPGINTQIAKLKKALPNESGRALDLKRLNAAALSLTQKRPAALEEPAAKEEKKEYQVDDATADEAYPPQLTLMDDQREALLTVYHDYAENIVALAKRQPLDQPAVDQIKDTVAALQQFMKKLEALLPMNRQSTAYQQAVEKLIHEEQRKSP